MNGKIIKDWKKVDFQSREGARKFYGALQHFMDAPRRPEVKAAIQQFTSKGDFPAEALAILEKFHIEANFDNGYERIFKIRDFTQTKESGFELLDVQSGLTFRKVPVGDKVELMKISGSKVSVNFDRFGGGLGWDKTWFDDGKWWKVEDTAIEFRNHWNAFKAQTHYDLIAAMSSGINEAWAAVTGSIPNTDANYVAIRDMNTINNAALTILKALKNKGVGATVNSRLVVLAPLDLRPRITRALGFLNANLAGSQSGVQFTIEPVYTLMLSATDKYYVCFPGGKAQGGNRQDLTILGPELDILQYTEAVAGWARFGAAIGDEDQFRRCSIA